MSKHTSFDINQLILVDENDNPIGESEKITCHLGSGQLHRAFSILLFNPQGQMLIQKRSEHKLLWPLFWSNACCSHPAIDESVEDACKRRLVQELNISADVQFIYKFQYYAKYLEVGAESELCHVMIGVSEQTPILIPEEVAEFKYVSVEQLDAMLVESPEQFTPWFKQEWQTLKDEFWAEVERLIGESTDNVSTEDTA